MKMIMAVIPKIEAETVMDQLIRSGYTATFVESRGGVMRQSQLILFIAVEQENVENVMEIIRNNCHSQININPPRQSAYDTPGGMPVTADMGGAVIFLWSLDKVQTG